MLRAMPLSRVVVLGSQNCSALSDRCTAGLINHSMITYVAIKPAKLMPVSFYAVVRPCRPEADYEKAGGRLAVAGRVQGHVLLLSSQQNV